MRSFFLTIVEIFVALSCLGQSYISKEESHREHLNPFEQKQLADWSISGIRSDQEVTREFAGFEENITNHIDNNQPIVIEGNVTASQDERDVTMDANNLLEFANQEPLHEMRYVILRRDKSFAEQVTLANTIYEVRYDFTLSANFIMPDNAELHFNGGVISGNHTLKLCGTTLSGHVRFNGVSLTGTLQNESVNPSWFGAVADGATDSTEAIQAAIDCANNISGVSKRLCFEGGTYLISAPLIVSKRISIDGFNTLLTTNNKSLSCFINIGNVTNLAGILIEIRNLRFSCPAGCNAYGIKYTNAMVVNNVLDNLSFSSFNKPCIFLESTAGQGYRSTGVYAHGIQWSHIITYSCSSLIGQSRETSGQPFIYGGVLEDFHFEGNHAGDDNEYVLDLYGFRNVDVRGLILEGVLAGSQKKALVNLREPCHFTDFYVELGAGSTTPKYTFYCDLRVSGVVDLSGYYGRLFAPFLLKNCEMRWETNGTNINDFPSFGIDNIVDTVNSSNYRIKVDNISLGTAAALTNNRKRFVPGIEYDGTIYIDTDRSMFVDNSEPIFIADLTKITLGASGSSLYGNGLFFWQKNPGNATLTTRIDPVFGEIAILESLSANNFLECGIYFDPKMFTNYFGGSPDNGMTLIITLVPLSTPATGDVDHSGSISQGESNNKYYPMGTYSMCIGPKIKTKNVPFTLISNIRKVSSSTYLLFRFDNPISGEVVDSPQKYAILEIALFKGMRFGKCKAKTLLQ